MFSSHFNMKVTSFFTDAELELALALTSELLDDHKAMEELSISFDAGNKLLELKDKIDIYYTDLLK
jgi:hypothetical protein